MSAPTLSTTVDLDALELRWHRTWRSLDLETGQSFHEVAALYSQPHRRYHTLRHLSECFQVADSVATVEVPAVLHLALWYHDIVYAPQSTSNELESADRCASALGRVGAPPSLTDTARGLILATQHHSSIADSPGASLMIDIDTSILGAPPVRYDEFETSIRQEYSWVPEQLYRDKRAAVLSRFLSKTPIYSTPELRDEFEVRARDNLKRAIAALSPGQSTAV